MRTLLAFLALSTAAAAQVTVTGTVLYEDRPYNNVNGFTASVNRPVRQAEIELLNPAGTTVLASGFTNESGDYSLTFAGPDQDAKIRVIARRTTGKINAVVRSNLTPKPAYAVVTSTFNTTASDQPVLITQAGGAGGAFNIFDCEVKNFQYMAALDATLPDPPALLTIFWDAGVANGTFFDGGADAIFLLGRNPDTDEYDDDIIFHEIGHWVAFHFSKDDTVGGQHSITDQLDPRLSWSEGWGHYWSAVVRKFVPAEYLSPQVQVDNLTTGAPRWFDIEGPSAPTATVWATNEVAVAAVLWDMVDTTNEPFDNLSDLEPQIWQAVHVRMKFTANNTLEDFHAGLLLDSPGLRLDVSGDPSTVKIFNARLIRYYADPSEVNDGFSSAPTISGLVTLRTSYPAGDPDWFTVVANRGTLIVETLNLGDGADTLLELWDETGSSMLMSNNNRSGGDKSSRISRSVAATTTFKVRVAQASPLVEYGTYDLQVSNPPKKKGGGDGGCGLTGWEVLVLLGMVRLARRR